MAIDFNLPTVVRGGSAIGNALRSAAEQEAKAAARAAKAAEKAAAANAKNKAREALDRPFIMGDKTATDFIQFTPGERNTINTQPEDKRLGFAEKLRNETRESAVNTMSERSAKAQKLREERQMAGVSKDAEEAKPFSIDGEKEKLNEVPESPAEKLARETSEREQSDLAKRKAQVDAQAKEKGVVGTAKELGAKAKKKFDEMHPTNKKILGGVAAAAALGLGIKGAFSFADYLRGGNDGSIGKGNKPAGGGAIAPVPVQDKPDASISAEAKPVEIAAKPIDPDSVPGDIDSLTKAFGPPIATMQQDQANEIKTSTNFRTATGKDGLVHVFDKNRLPLAVRQKKQAEQDAADATARTAKSTALASANASMSPDQQELAKLKAQPNWTKSADVRSKELQERISLDARNKAANESSIPVQVAKEQARAMAAESKTKNDLNERALRVKEDEVKIDALKAKQQERYQNAKTRQEQLQAIGKNDEEFASLEVGALIDEKEGNPTIAANMQRFSPGFPIAPKNQQAWTMGISRGLREIKNHEMDANIPIGEYGNAVQMLLAKAKSNAKTSDQMRQELFGEQPSAPSWWSRIWN